MLRDLCRIEAERLEEPEAEGGTEVKASEHSSADSQMNAQRL